VTEAKAEQTARRAAASVRLRTP